MTAALALLHALLLPRHRSRLHPASLGVLPLPALRQVSAVTQAQQQSASRAARQQLCVHGCKLLLPQLCWPAAQMPPAWPVHVSHGPAE